MNIVQDNIAHYVEGIWVSKDKMDSEYWNDVSVRASELRDFKERDEIGIGEVIHQDTIKVLEKSVCELMSVAVEEAK